MQKKQSRVFVFLLLWIVVMIAVPLVKAKAAATLEVVEIDYDKETLTVRSNSGDTFLYYSDSKKKNWECAYGQFVDAGTSTSEGSTNTSGRIYVLDISWVKKTKDYDLTLKGDVSTEVLTVKLPVQNKYFKVTYNYEKQEFVPQNADNCPLQWRKADSAIWHDVVGEDRSTKETVSMMNKLYAKGAYIYVRTKPQNGDKTTTGVRPSKEIKISLKKQASAPSVYMKTAGILTVNPTQEYQVGGSDTWTKCNEKTLDLRKVATDAFYKEGTPGKEVTIYVRVAATEKKLPSASTVITVRAQEEAPVSDSAGENNQIKYSFKNATTLQVEFNEVKETGEDGKEVVVKEKPSSKNPYEYTVVKPAEGADTVPADAQPAEDATWTAITAGTVTISAEKAPEGSVLFIRKRGRLESKVVYQPESLACKYTVGEYPTGSTVALVEGNNPNAAFMEIVTTDGTEATYLRLVKEQGGTTADLKFVIDVTDYITDVSSITCGGKSLKFDTEVVTGSAVTSSITVSITDTSEYEAVLKEFNQDQPLKITLKNGEVISDKVTLKVLQGASVEKVETFEVIHRTDQKEFEFVVKAGMVNKGKDNTVAPTYTTIEEIYFQNEKLAKDAYTVTPSNNAESYTVTISEKAFDNAFLNREIKLDEAYPLVIEMSNEQEVSGISVKLHENMKVESVLQFSFQEGKGLSKDTEIKFIGTSGVVLNWKWYKNSFSGSSSSVNNETIVTILDVDLKQLKAGLLQPIIFEFADGSLVSRAILLSVSESNSSSN